MCRWITAVLRLCCRYRIHFTFIMQHSGPSCFLCGWLHLVIFSIPAHLLFAWRSPPNSGLKCFPSSLPDSGALGDCFPGSEQHAARAGGSAYHTCCKIKGHSWRSGIMGGGKIIFFYSFPFVFDRPVWPATTCTPTPPHILQPLRSGVSFQERLGGVKDGWGLLMYKNNWLDETLSRALKRFQGQWMWELLLSPGSDGNSDQIKDSSWVMCSVRSHLFITAGGEYHIYSRSVMEGTLMMPDVCHQQVWMTCHHTSDCSLYNSLCIYSAAPKHYC